MTLLIVGLILFLGTHSARIFAEDWRNALIARVGLMPWKGIYSVLSLAGLVLIAYGYGDARTAPIVLWSSGTGARHAASLLTLIAFVLLAAAYVPRNRIRARLRHPMVLAVKTWALAHLISNGTLADLLLFGGFLLWAVLSFRAARGRDRQAAAMTAEAAGNGSTHTGAAAGSLAFDLGTIAAGLLAWWAFAFHLHARWIGVNPMG